MVSTIEKSPIFTPPRRWAQCGAIDIDSWPPATMMSASPVAICCMPSATRAEPRAAELVQPPGGRLLRQAGADRRLARRVLALAGGQDLAEDDLVDLVRLDLGAGRAPRVIATAPSSCAGIVGEGAVEGADGGAGGAGDDDVGGLTSAEISLPGGRLLARLPARPFAVDYSAAGRSAVNPRRVAAPHIWHCTNNWRALGKSPYRKRAEAAGQVAPGSGRPRKVGFAGSRSAMDKPTDKEPTTIKKYANRRLYNTGTSTYVTLEDLAEMVKSGEDFVVYRRQDRRGHHPLGAHPDHLRAGEQGPEPPADHVPPPAHPLLRRFHPEPDPDLSRLLDRLARPRSGEAARAR